MTDASNVSETFAGRQSSTSSAGLEPVFAPATFFTGLGILFVVLGLSYSFGTPRDVGPGVFPVMLGTILILLGAGVAFEDFRNEKEALPAIAWKPLLTVLGAILLFALLLERAGFLISAFILLMAGFFAVGEGRWRRALVFTAVVVGIAAFLFHGALRVSFPLLP